MYYNHIYKYQNQYTTNNASENIWNCIFKGTMLLTKYSLNSFENNGNK